MTPEQNRRYTLITMALIVMSLVVTFAIGMTRHGGDPFAGDRPGHSADGGD